MRLSTRIAVAAVGLSTVLAATACTTGSSPGGGTAAKNVEVFTWWADGGEKAGLDNLVGTFGTACSNFTFVNGAIAGGAGSNAKQVLAQRLATNQPPDTFQAHAGAELTDYINAGQVQDLSQQYKDWGLTDAFPKGLIENLTVSGKIYSVPANIHRANVLWSNKTVTAGAGITKDATTLDAFFADLEKLKAKGVTPLALGKDWTQLMLFESVLISDLGADKFTGLWKGTTDWAGADVTNFLKQYAEAGMTIEVAGGVIDSAYAWPVGEALRGHFPIIWWHELTTPASVAWAARYIKRWGRPPDNQAYGDYIAVHAIAQAIDKPSRRSSGT